MPMPHSTSQTKRPKAETLLYLTTFARVYDASLANETFARSLAYAAAYGKNGKC